MLSSVLRSPTAICEGRKCFAFTKLDAGAIRGIKKSAFGVGAKAENLV